MAVIKNNKTGMWEVRTYYKDLTGARKQKTKRGFDKKSEALEWERNFKLKEDQSISMSFKSFVDIYLTDLEPRIKRNTFLTKKHIIETKILPYFGKRKLDDIRTSDVIQLLKPIQEKKIDKTVRDTSLKSLKDTINALEQTNGGKSGELMLDMQVTEDDISELLQRITTATYNVDGYYLGESSQGLGYSNMIYIHLQLKEYEKGVDPLKVNMFFLEEPESHMHPQMQQVFIKYLMDYYHTKLQGLITTHSNEMVRTVGLSHLRVIRHAGNFKSKLYDLSTLLKDLKKSENLSDKELANFFDWFFEIGYSEIVFADKAIFYEGDTERLFIRKAMTLEKYKKLSQQYVAFIQVGGAYAKNYEKLIRLLGIKSLIITDIDYEKEKLTVADIEDSTITNATIKHFYSLNHPTDNALVKNLYAWKNTKENIMDNLIYICFQTDHDGYARTLEEAMLNKYFSMSVTDLYKKSEWVQKRKDSKLDFSIPNKRMTKKFLMKIWFLLGTFWHQLQEIRQILCILLL